MMLPTSSRSAKKSSNEVTPDSTMRCSRSEGEAQGWPRRSHFAGGGVDHIAAAVTSGIEFGGLDFNARNFTGAQRTGMLGVILRGRSEPLLRL